MFANLAVYQKCTLRKKFPPFPAKIFVKSKRFPVFPPQNEKLDLSPAFPTGVTTLHFQVLTQKKIANLKKKEGVFRTQSNIQDGAFCENS